MDHAPAPDPGRAPRRGRTADDPATRTLDLLGGLEPGLLVALRPVPGDADVVAVHALAPDPRCGGAGLFGMEAPTGSVTAGCSFRGHATASAEPGRDDGPAPEAGPVERVDVVVARDGRVLSRLHRRRPGSPDPVATDAVGPAAGVVVDSLHRVLGLPCPGHPPPVEALVASLWLQDLVTATTSGLGLSWSDAVDLHPHPPAVGAVLPSPETLAQATKALVGEVTWDRLRQFAADRRIDVFDLSPDEAAWMDATFFARWVIESFPPAGQVVATLEQGGAGPASAGVRSVLHRLGVPLGNDHDSDRQGGM
jgi:hypothetical protein